MIGKFVSFKKGDELRDTDGRVLLTFVEDWNTHEAGGLDARKIILPDGRHPHNGEVISAAIIRVLGNMTRHDT